MGIGCSSLVERPQLRVMSYTKQYDPSIHLSYSISSYFCFSALTYGMTSY